MERVFSFQLMLLLFLLAPGEVILVTPLLVGALTFWYFSTI